MSSKVFFYLQLMWGCWTKTGTRRTIETMQTLTLKQNSNTTQRVGWTRFLTTCTVPSEKHRICFCLQIRQPLSGWGVQALYLDGEYKLCLWPGSSIHSSIADKSPILSLLYFCFDPLHPFHSPHHPTPCLPPASGKHESVLCICELRGLSVWLVVVFLDSTYPLLLKLF